MNNKPHLEINFANSNSAVEPAAKSWVDAHGHLTDPRWLAQGPEVMEALIAKSAQLGLGYFMQGGVGPEEWQEQLQLSKRFPQQVGLCFGLHPYWVSEHSTEECEEAMDLLATLASQAQALGEMGLDFRPQYLKNNPDHQIEFFENQLQLATSCNKPVVLHLVQAHEEALQIIDIWGLPPAGGFVHSFNGSAKKAQEFLERGLMLSIGGPVCRPDNQRLHQAVQILPLDRLLIESDSPDQAPPELAGQLNPPESVLIVAKVVGSIKSLDPGQILDISSANFRRLIRATDRTPAQHTGKP